MSSLGPHVFDLIRIETGHPNAAHVDFTPQSVQRFLVDNDHRSQIRFEAARGRLDVWIQETNDEGYPDDEAPYPLEIHLAHARITDLSDTGVTVEGVEVEDLRLTGRAVKVMFTSKHSGW